MTMNYVNVNGDKYVPIDVIDDLPRVRILRALRRFDKVMMGDLMTALELHDTPTVYRFQIHVRNLVREGLVHCDGKHGSMTYWIADTGRAYLERICRRAFLED